jgi:hypothetical protein
MHFSKTRLLDRTAFTKTTLHAADSADRDYWISRTPEERSEAFEFLREQYIALHYETRGTEFQRVCTLVERKRRSSV